MTNWTKEQLDAINTDNSNIIISAGAGSGKTAVLSERVLRKLKSGIDIDKLLILTFTKAAADEMKQRIRKKIIADKSLGDQLNKIDNAYITTFDSYALSIVKKYHHLLNLPSDIEISESSIIELNKENILNDILNDYYNSENEKFLNLISDFCTKDDEEIRKSILSINNKLDMIYNKSEYINNYFNNFYNANFIDEKVKEYEEILLSKINEINEILLDIEEYADDEYYEMINNSLSELLLSDNYNLIKDNLNVKLPQLPKNSEEELKKKKERISILLKELKNLCIYNNTNEIKEGILKTKDYVSIILEIVNKLDEKIKKYKLDNNLFEFTDIAILAIKILQNNHDVCLEIKNNFNEIMIDEYQDTNNLQELFISYIENNNVYMVGDIKQSIYRFRNANPKLFQDKYDSYSINNGGIKIDLNKNFRSRIEVLDDINLIFKNIMTNKIGGANYESSHQMIFGNNLFNECGKNNQNNNLEILSYNTDKNIEFTKQEIEIFIIAKDIKERIENNYQVFDMNLNKNRPLEYNDIAILMDRTTNFDLYKKIFEYFNIPLNLYKDEKITSNMNISIIKNILNLIIKVNNNCYDKSFEYSYVSVARSYLFRLNDKDIFNMLENKNYNSVILNKIKNISANINSYNLEEIIHKIIEEFNFYERIITIGDIDNNIVCLDYICTLADNLSKIGYTYIDFYNYINKIIKKDYDIRFSTNNDSGNSVKIMTIHKSKGLEFPICYYSGLYSKFNIQDIKDKFIFDGEYGIITPYIDRGIHFTIYRDLLKNRYIQDEVSEKIRLLYVALTRAKEKMVLVGSFEDNEFSHLNDSVKLKYRSFLDIINSVINFINNRKSIDINLLNLTKEYNNVDNYNYKSKIKKCSYLLKVNELSCEDSYVDKSTFSKNCNEIYDKEKFLNIECGKKIHLVFENIDFLTPDYSDLDSFSTICVEKFIKTDIFKGVKNIYKEYEFVENFNNELNHGIIDLLLEYENCYKIIDYKLKNINDSAYKKQLYGYKEYMEKITNKEVQVYLYSILDGVLEQI